MSQHTQTNTTVLLSSTVQWRVCYSYWAENLLTFSAALNSKQQTNGHHGQTTEEQCHLCGGQVVAVNILRKHRLSYHFIHNHHCIHDISGIGQYVCKCTMSYCKYRPLVVGMWPNRYSNWWTATWDGMKRWRPTHSHTCTCTVSLE